MLFLYVIVNLTVPSKKPSPQYNELTDWMKAPTSKKDPSEASYSNNRSKQSYTHVVTYKPSPSREGAAKGGKVAVKKAGTFIKKNAPEVKKAVKKADVSYVGASRKAEAYSDLSWHENPVDLMQKASRTKNKISPNAKETGDHVVYKKNTETGEITNYKVYKVNSKNPNGFDEVIGYDGIGQPHLNLVTGEDLLPHVHDKTAPGKVRPPYKNEIPR